MNQTACMASQDFEEIEYSARYVIDYAGSSSEGVDLSTSQSATGPLRSVVDRFHAFAVPMAIVASLFAPAEPRYISRTRSSSVTGMVRAQFSWVHDEWRYMPEYITEQQVEELRNLLSLPAVPDVGFDYRDYLD